jgi:energy-coupling factor transporter ATP-binding protein EcfA2
MNKLTISQASQLTDDEKENFLKKAWNIEDKDYIEVIGELISTYNYIHDSYHYRLYNIKLENGERIEYPISNLIDNNKIISDGVYVPYQLDDKIKGLAESGKKPIISCNLILSSLSERGKHNNPFLLNVDFTSVILLDVIEKKEVIKDINGNILISESIVQRTIQENQKIISEKLRILKEKEKKNEEEVSELEKKLLLKKKNIKLDLEKIEKDILIKKETFEKRQKKEIDRLEAIFHTKRENIKLNLGKLKAKEIKKEQAIEKLEVKRKTIVLNIETKENRIEELIQKIEELRKILNEEERIMGKKLEKLRTYIKDKADTLLDLEFIDKEEYNNLMMINEKEDLDEKFVDFEKDLLRDKQTAISHIQAYLFEQDIIYPRYILEDFFALIQTNDLIILAGESGSGKTNLIKSFAKSIGGKSFIIPVKPNWTSSEDLLGYYNPLEKKYLATPFLEALLEAKDNPDVPYFICLDEMNLARVEYYFADFLSLLEERGEQPEIKLYSEDESSHILSEFKNVIDTIAYTKEKYKKGNIVNFVKLLQDEEVNKELTRVFGFSDKDSLIKYHTDLRRMLSGILNTPSSIIFPRNVRIIGAINIDETTHYLSPKILDRAHIMKFDSPLLQDWTKIAKEIEDVAQKELKIKFKIEDLGEREAYPSYDREDEFCQIITKMTKEYFSPLGIEVGLRTIRQGLNYQKIFMEQGSNKELMINNFMIHKILPKMTFDGNKKVNEEKKNDLLQRLMINLQEYINQDLTKEKSINVIDELKKIIKISDSNDGIVNYWA